jgi:hypothetical protein
MLTAEPIARKALNPRRVNRPMDSARKSRRCVQAPQAGQRTEIWGMMSPHSPQGMTASRQKLRTSAFLAVYVLLTGALGVGYATWRLVGETYLSCPVTP